MSVKHLLWGRRSGTRAATDRDINQTARPHLYCAPLSAVNGKGKEAENRCRTGTSQATDVKRVCLLYKECDVTHRSQQNTVSGSVTEFDTFFLVSYHISCGERKNRATRTTASRCQKTQSNTMTSSQSVLTGGHALVTKVHKVANGGVVM